MSDFPQQINNSYESGSSSNSTTHSNENALEKSMQLDGIEGNKLTALMVNASASDLYNSSAEEGIFPNVSDYPEIQAPSYQRDYDYQIEYSNTPLVYSWLPIVPGFNPDGFNNLHNFDHLADKQFLASDGSPQSQEISNQNLKYHDFLKINNTSKLVNDSCELENSSNAMDFNISFAEDSVANPDLSFVGKIDELKEQEEEKLNLCELEELVEFKAVKAAHLHNELFEMQKQEINEKSLELFASNAEVNQETEAVEPLTVKPVVSKHPEDCEKQVLKKIRNSLAGVCPPPSVTKNWAEMSLSEMLSAYNKNSVGNPVKSEVKSSSFFIPSASESVAQKTDWPMSRSLKCLAIAYNKSTDTEDIERLSLQYSDRFVSAQTTSSFNHKVGPSSAKKKIEYLKKSTQSPGRRLSHLANRRKVFSSETLKSSSLNTSHSLRQINKSVLYSKARKTKSPLKRSSAKKKTPGKKKTPKSAKRQPVARAETSRNSSKRALFTSPIGTSSSLTLPASSTELPPRQTMARKALFSPVNDENRKRRSSPDQDFENRRKFRRLESPTKLPKSQSFSIASTSSRPNLNESFRKQLFRTQSEVFPQAKAATLGYKEPMTPLVKKKLLWSISNALKLKQISNEHEKFKEFLTTLASLVKKIFYEFYDPKNKSVSDQMAKFSNHMVYSVIQGQSKEEILKATRLHFQSKTATRVSGYIGPQEYEQNKQYYFQKSNSLLMASQSYSSLNISLCSDSSFDENSSSSRLAPSCSSINLSSSKNNEVGALRENFQPSDHSARKYSGSDSTLNRAKSNSSSSLMKAKRQISF